MKSFKQYVTLEVALKCCVVDESAATLPNFTVKLTRLHPFFVLCEWNDCKPNVYFQSINFLYEILC